MKVPTSGSSSKGINSKGLNVIPIKNLNIQRENITGQSNFNPSDKLKLDRLSPKPKDTKVTSGIGSGVSPRSKLSPTSAKNVISDKSNYDSKYSNKIYTNITNNLMHKSPSPKHTDNKTKLGLDKKIK